MKYMVIMNRLSLSVLQWGFFVFCSLVSFFLEVLHFCVLSDNLDATEIPDHSNVQRVASLLGVPKQSLIDALTRRTIFAS
jgi:myosin-7